MDQEAGGFLLDPDLSSLFLEPASGLGVSVNVDAVR